MRGKVFRRTIGCLWLALAAWPAAAQIQAADDPFSDALIAVDTTGIAPSDLNATLVRGVVAPEQKKDSCLVNPPIVTSARGAVQAIENGNLVFNGVGRATIEIVLTVPAVITDFAVVPEEWKDRGPITLVIDRIEFPAGGRPKAEYGIANRFYDIIQVPGGLTLRVRSGADDVVVCPDFDQFVPVVDQQIVEADLSRPAAWVSYADTGENGGRYPAPSWAAVLPLARYSGTPGGSSNYRESAIQQARMWRTTFSTEDARWDRCDAGLIGARREIRFKCTNIALIATQTDPSCCGVIGWLERRLRSLSQILDRRHDQHLRVTFTSMPDDAGIYVGPLLQGHTTRVLDIVESDLRASRLEKQGYKPCPYNNWDRKKLPSAGPRQAFEMHCTLTLANRPRRRH